MNTSNPSLDRTTLDTAWPQIRPALLRYAARLDHPQEAADHTAQTYLTAISILERFRTTPTLPNLTRWLMLILRNLCRNHVRQVARRNEILMPTEQLVNIAEMNQEESDTQESKEDLRSYQRLIENYQIYCLHRRRSEIWQLWRSGKKETEIAAALGLTQQAISYHISRIIDELRVNAGSLITRREDGYTCGTAMFRDVSRATVYHAPKRTGSGISAARLRRMR